MESSVEAHLSRWIICFGLIAILLIAIQYIYVPLYSSPLSRIPGPKLFASTKWRLAYEDWKGARTSSIHRLHEKYGSAVRIGPDEVSFSDQEALRAIYGAGSGFERDTFYRMFDVYGRQNLFTFASSSEHAARKKLLSHAYSKSNIIKGPMAAMVEEKVRQYLRLLETEADSACEIFTNLHYFSIDSITHFLYGKDHGATTTLTGSAVDRALLDDIMIPTRRRLSWFAVHFPATTKWLYTRTGIMEHLATWLDIFPMRKPATYTGIRAHALKAWLGYKEASIDQKTTIAQDSIVGLLWNHQASGKKPFLEDLDIASECADHLLAGIDTTSDTLMFLIWALSLPANRIYQQRLIKEISTINKDGLVAEGIPSVAASDKLPYLDATIKETLRLYAPLPASEPRSLAVDSTINGYVIPARTVVGMSPYSLHRNEDVFPDSLKFNPDRWLDASSDLTEMKKWFWAFSSGARMCIGLHLAMAEMKTLTAAIYQNYTTQVRPGDEKTSPGITSRFEVFYDETCERMEEHTCWIDFRKHGS
ncbi:MAG: hypothetical protein M1818_001388 [Claussenomyces sp. TS43310]|nr:MAG: hypothetical protein M1818_001388 [Claussenomyces sp. TS43310]